MNAVDGLDAVLASVGAALGIGGVSLLSTAVAVPIAVGLEIGSLGCAGLCALGRVFRRRLARKHDKHKQIEVLARAKLNSISDLVSKALADDVISAAEYRLVAEELEKFEKLKQQVRNKKEPPAERVKELKSHLLEEISKEALAEITKKLNAL